MAAGTGYSESKWVGEQLLAIASRETPLSTISLRVGQIAGSDNGAWNVHEWVPSLIKSSIHLVCVPMFAVVSEICLWFYTSLIIGAERIMDECLYLCQCSFRMPKHVNKTITFAPRTPSSSLLEHPIRTRR